MPKKYRLTGDEMKSIRGTRIHGALFSLIVAPIKSDHAKTATVVSKKVALSAVKRNGIERRVRAVLFKHIGPLKQPIALVFYAKREAAAASFAQIEEDIAALLSRIPARP